MEIPVINRIGGIDPRQNPSFLSQIFSLSGVERVHQASSFWKWGALILALLASFSTIINRLKLLIIRIQNHYLTSSPTLHNTEQDYDYDSETDTSLSSISDDEEEEEEEEEKENEPSPSFSWRHVDEDFRVKGSGYYMDGLWRSRNLRRRRNNSIEDLFSSWSDFTSGKNVVKLWDNLGLGFNINNQPTNCVSVFDMNKDVNVFSIFGEKFEIPAVAALPPPVIVSAETEVSKHSLKVWDTRVGMRLPGILAEWSPRLGRIVGIHAGGGKVGEVFVKDDVTGRLTVGDMRKGGSPLVDPSEAEVDRWWDADAVIVDELSGDDSVLRRG